LRRVETNQREIAYWESRTTETEKAALELALCMEAVDRLARLWDEGDSEDKQGIARTLFSYVVYDLDARWIVDFQLKSWADRFLVLRTALYETENGASAPSIKREEGTKLDAPDMTPEGFETSSSAYIEWAVQRMLARLYAKKEPLTQPVTDLIPLKEDRNAEIYQRFLAGERAVDLAKEYGISLQRIYVLIRRQKRRKKN
jgi:Mor transcription activator family protein